MTANLPKNGAPVFSLNTECGTERLSCTPVRTRLTRNFLSVSLQSVSNWHWESSTLLRMALARPSMGVSRASTRRFWLPARATPRVGINT
jgi:hypothetical protein